MAFGATVGFLSRKDRIAGAGVQGGVSIKIIGNRKVRQAFRRMNRKMLDLRKPLRKVGRLIYKITKKQFATQGAHRSGGWQQLSHAYALRKVKDIGLQPILQYTGELARGLTVRSHPDAIFLVGKKSLKIGSSNWKFQVHEGIVDSNNPERKVFEFTNKDLSEMDKIVADAIIDEWKMQQRGHK